MIKQEIIELSTNRCGGEGTLTVHKIVSGEEMNGHGLGINVIELPAGTSIGVHPHLGSSEQFYVLEGQGEFTNNGSCAAIQAGQTGVMKPGDTHGIKNTGTEVMKIITVHTFE